MAQLNPPTVDVTFSGLTAEEALQLTTQFAAMRGLRVAAAQDTLAGAARDPHWAGKELQAEPDGRVHGGFHMPVDAGNVEPPAGGLHTAEEIAKDAAAKGDAKPAEKHPPKAEKAAKPPKAQAAAPVPTEPSKNGVSHELPPAVVNAKTFREVVTYLRDTENLKDRDAIAARCEQLRGTVGIVKPVKNLAERVEYVLAAIQAG